MAVGVLTGGTHTQRQPEDVDIADGEALYQAHCAACHGARLEGQENWQTASGDGPPPAPPHDASGHTWHHGDDLLFTYTKLGGAETLARQGVQFESGMPGFGEDLSDRDIWNILAFIKSTWPQRVKEVQAARTAAE
nr:cytochrome c [Tropicimonas isoalkanivorans]